MALVQRACKLEPVLPPTFVSSLGDCYYLVRKFDAALATYRTLIDPPYFFRLNEAACLAQLGKADEAMDIVREAPDSFDLALYVRNCAKVCALSDDAELWLSGFRMAGVPV